MREEYIDKVIDERNFASLVIPLEDELNFIETVLKRGSTVYQGKKYIDMVTEKEKKEYIQANFRKIIVNPDSKKIIDITYK